MKDRLRHFYVVAATRAMGDLPIPLVEGQAGGPDLRASRFLRSQSHKLRRHSRRAARRSAPTAAPSHVGLAEPAGKTILSSFEVTFSLD